MARWWEKPGRLQWNEGRALEPDHWYTPLGNIIPPVRALMSGIPDKVLVKDDTLREGEEAPNHKPITVEMKLELARELEEAGIRETEVGFPATLESHYEITKRLKAEGTKMRLSAHPRPTAENWKWNIEKTAESGVDVVYMLFPANDEDIFNLRAPSIKISKEHIIDDLCQHVTNAVEYAKSLGLIVRAGISTSTKAPLERVAPIFKAIKEAGADRAHVSDGFGCNTPEAMKFYVRFVKGIVGDIPVATHCHNDYGLANTNVIAAVTAGCEVIDLSVNGLGDRAGIAALEVVVPVLEVLYGVDTGVNMERLTHLSKFVEELYGIKVQQNYPIVGDSMWIHEEDPHIARVLKARERGGDAWAAYNIMNPKMVGGHEQLNWSLTSVHKGPNSATAIKIRQMGLLASDKQFDDIINRILEFAEKNNYATEKEVEKIIQETLKS